MSLTTKSKFLSLILRHKPEEVGLSLDSEGWADVNELVEKSDISLADLKEIVATDNKQRYSFSVDSTKIRANQGHSVQVDLGLKPQQPPDCLHHGTSDRFLESIGKHGLTKQARQHVHLSKDPTTAKMVGQRHGGKCAVLTIDAKQMYEDGHLFFLSENGVWLTDKVPQKYIKGITSQC